MTQNEIIEMAKQAGLTSIDKKSAYLRDCLERFAKLVAAKEREALKEQFRIVTAAETHAAILNERANNALLCYQQRKHWDALACSDAIRAGTRARGEA